ncbi:MAG: phosphomethylpyrimidine synthase ThiC [Phycisphaerales bacterium]
MTTINTHEHLAQGSPAWKANTLATAALRDAATMRSALRITQPAQSAPNVPYPLPIHGAHIPASDSNTTSPGSFAHAPDIGGPYAFSSPDTPGMPAPSDKTAWDFLPDDWAVEIVSEATERPSDEATKSSNNTNGAPHAHDESSSRGVSGKETLPPVGAVSNRPESPSVAPSLRRSVATFTDARGVTRRITYPANFTPITQLEHARLGIITPEMRRVAQREPHLTPEQVRDELAAGRLIIPANIKHLQKNLDPMAIGRATRTKVNANMGASPISSGSDEELEKLRWAERWGADTVMDLSTGGDLDACRQAILDHSTVPIGTVPIYSVIIARKLEDLDERVVMDTLKHQAEQGVDYFTIHAGVRREHLKLVKNRLIGIVSRGGSLLAKWMLTHARENLMYTMWDDICDLLRTYDVSFSIGDGLRPGGLADATDAAQLAELQTLGELTERAWRRGVQVMIEGPGHVPFDQIEFNAKLQRRLCHGAPFYVLGPLVTDVFPGYDHITSAIGATSIAYHGASMLCYVTPKEHLGLPKRSDVKDGCIAYKIAAHAADVALGIPATRDWDDQLTKARAALNWNKHFQLAFDEDTARAFHDEDLDVDTDFCAMCGHDWCSVRISKEIQDFASGKAQGFESLGPKRSDALTPDQQAILEQRGYLSPDEVHKLASKVKKSPLMPDARSPMPPSKAACHSDYVDSNEAQRLQSLVQLNTAPAHNLPSEDRVI